MKIISLSHSEAGSACSVGTFIKRFYNQKTNFFDYLVVDMKTINNIINIKDLNLIINNYEYEEQEAGKNITIKFNNFSKLISYHDIKYNNNESIIEFKNKYMRRYHRLMSYLYEEDIIFFIRYGKTSYFEIKEFINNIKIINKNLIIYFINVDYDENYLNNIYYSDIENYIYINFNAINKKNIINDDIYFRILEYNWEFVFNLINDNLKLYK